MKHLHLAAPVTFAGALFVLLSLNGCHWSDKAPEYGYGYFYYPNSEVYYYPTRGVWWWQERNEWREGWELPKQYDIKHDTRISLRLGTDKPYLMHDHVRAEHPAHPDADRH